MRKRANTRNNFGGKNVLIKKVSLSIQKITFRNRFIYNWFYIVLVGSLLLSIFQPVESTFVKNLEISDSLKLTVQNTTVTMENNTSAAGKNSVKNKKEAGSAVEVSRSQINCRFKNC